MLVLLDLSLDLSLPPLRVEFNDRHVCERGGSKFAGHEFGNPGGSVLVELDTPATVMVPECNVRPCHFNPLFGTVANTPLEKSGLELPGNIRRNPDFHVPLLHEVAEGTGSVHIMDNSLSRLALTGRSCFSLGFVLNVIFLLIIGWRYIVVDRHIVFRPCLRLCFLFVR